MKNQFLVRLISSLVAILLFLTACSPSSSSASSSNVELVQTDSRQEIYQETIHLNNCGGTRDAEQTITRSFSTNIEGNVTVKAGYEVVEGSIGAKYGEAKNITKSIKVVAAPGTNMEFVLEWTEQTWVGRVTASNETGNYTAKSPISVAQVSANNLGCNNVSGSVLVPNTSESNSGQTTSSDPRDIAARTLGYDNLDALIQAFEIPTTVKSRIFVCSGEETWCLGVMEESGQSDFNFHNITSCTLDGKQSNGTSNIPSGFSGTIKGFTLRPCR